MSLKKIVSFICMVSLTFTNFFFCSAGPVNSQKRIAFFGDPMVAQEYKIADRIKQKNYSDVLGNIDDKKFNIGSKEYIDFDRRFFYRNKDLFKKIPLNVAVIVVSYNDYVISQTVKKYIEVIDKNNVSVMLVGYSCDGNNGRGEEYEQSVKQAAKEHGISEENVFFVEDTTGRGIDDVDSGINRCCLKDEKSEQEYKEIPQQPVNVIPNVTNDVSSESLAVKQVSDGSNNVDGEKIDNYQEPIHQEIVSDKKANDQEVLTQKISQCSKESKSQEKNKIDWFNILKIGAIGSIMCSVIMHLWHKIVPSNSDDK